MNYSSPWNLEICIKLAYYSSNIISKLAKFHLISVLCELSIVSPEHFAIASHSTLVLLVKFQPRKPSLLLELTNTIYLMALSTLDLLQNPFRLDSSLHWSLTAFTGPQDVEVGAGVVQKRCSSCKLIRLEQTIYLARLSIGTVRLLLDLGVV